MAPEEISNLPIQSHQRYAEDQEALKRAPGLKEDRLIAGPAQVDVTEPAYPSSLTALTGQDLANLQWALIDPPAIMGARRTDIFKEDLIPRLGNNQKLQILKERLESLPET